MKNITVLIFSLAVFSCYISATKSKLGLNNSSSLATSSLLNVEGNKASKCAKHLTEVKRLRKKHNRLSKDLKHLKNKKKSILNKLPKTVKKKII